MAYNQPPYGQPNYGAPPPQGQSPQPPYNQPPYGAPPPQGHSPYPPQQGYPPPPQNYSQQPGYGQPPQQGYPPPQQNYNQQPGYGQPPPQQYPPQQYGAPPPGPPGQYGAPPPGQYPQQPQYNQPPPQQYGQQPAYNPPPPQQGYGQQPNYGAPVYGQPAGPPTPPSIGYGAPQVIAWNGDADANALRKAMKGFGTDEKTLISTLANKDPLQVEVIRAAYTRLHKRQLLGDVQSEVSGWFEKGLCAIIRGPLEQDCHNLYEAMDGPGTKEKVLNDVLLGRSNADLNAIKSLYQRKYHKSLEDAIKADLSMKTERHFLMVLTARRNEDSIPVNPQEVDHDAQELYKATEGKVGTDELLVCNILTQRNDAQIRAIAQAYKAKYQRDLEAVIKKEFSGHMEDALIHQLRTGTDKARRDAILLEEAMSGVGTKDHLLIERVIRVHWDKNYATQVKGAYQATFRKNLVQRIEGETSGDYERLMVACLGGR